jgi:hypothetical protein
MFTNFLKKIIIATSLTATWTSGIWTAVQIKQDNVNANFAQSISAKAFDRATGTFYVATGAANNDKTLAKAERGATTFTSLNAVLNAANYVIPINSGVGAGIDANDIISSPLISLLNGVNQKFLVALAGAGGNVVRVFNPIDGTNMSTSNVLQTSAAGNIALASAATGLRLCTGTADVAAEPKGRAFVYVYPHGTLAGSTGSSVRQVRINTTSGVVSAAVNPGDAVLLDRTNGALGNVANANTHGWVNDLYWDDEIKVLYAGLSIIGANANAQQTICGLVKTTIDPNSGNLSVFASAYGANPPGPVVYPGDNRQLSTIFAVTKKAGATWKQAGRVVIQKIRTMKTSTSKKYLIVNGAAGSMASFNYSSQYMNIYALRINNNPNDNDALRGNIVQNNTDGDILPANWERQHLEATLVGTDELPSLEVEFDYISDMEIVDDTVYVSVIFGDDPGIWSSRALFNSDGVIINWTPWERVFTSGNDANNIDKAKFIAVDGKTGVVWQVNQAAGGPPGDPKIVRRTEWKKEGWPQTNLPYKLNADLPDGCTAVLDLPQGTPGLGNTVVLNAANQHNSFALFGGNGKVIFAQTKYGNTFEETVDFSPNTRYKVTTLPSLGVGYVRALGFSRFPARVLNFGGHNNFFFVGTDSGLFAFADSNDRSGWNSNTGFTNLTAAPFNTYTWVPMAKSIKGAVTAIESNGDCLFVVEQDVTSEGSIVSKLHRFPIAANVTTMEKSQTIIAQSGAARSIPENAIITGFAILQDGTDRNHAFGILATSAGIYKMASTGNVHSMHNFDPQAATDSWTLIDAKAATGLFTNKRGGAATNDGIALNVARAAFDDKYNGTLPQEVISILGTTWAATHEINNQAILPYVNAAAPLGNGLTTLDRLTAFWSDGGRRFFATYNPNDSVGNTLKSMPFATTEWNMNGPETIAGLTGVNRINWIENISGIGMLMAGTDKGVITLE